jgi:phosphoribosylformylglycinamidine cyclo-ligase
LRPHGEPTAGLPRDETAATRSRITYRDAGVDVAAASAAVTRIKARVEATYGGTDAAPIGHFGGMYRLAAGPDRILVASADGIGTKIKLAFVLGGDAHARVAADLVNHCVNDILALGARPLFFLDYVAMGRLDPTALDGLIAGMADACAANGLALIGGETAEMPGLYAPGEYDVAGFIVGEVAPDAIVDGSSIREGDVLIGLPSDGLHTNG